MFSKKKWPKLYLEKYSEHLGKNSEKIVKKVTKLHLEKHSQKNVDPSEENVCF